MSEQNSFAFFSGSTSAAVSEGVERQKAMEAEQQRKLKDNLQQYLLDLVKQQQERKLTKEEEANLEQEIVALERLLEAYLLYPAQTVMTKATQMSETCPRAGRLLPLYIGMQMVLGTQDPKSKTQFEVV